MPKITTTDGSITVQEAARKLRQDKIATASIDYVAVVIRRGCARGNLAHRKQEYGVSGRTMTLVQYEDVKAFWGKIQRNEIKVPYINQWGSFCD